MLFRLLEFCRFVLILWVVFCNCVSVSPRFNLLHMPQPMRSLGKDAFTVNYRHPSCPTPEKEGASCHSSLVDEPVIGTSNYQGLPGSSAHLQRPWLSLPTTLPGLLNIKHLFVLEAQRLLSPQLALCTPLCMPVRDCLPRCRHAHLDNCFRTSYNVDADVQTQVFLKTLRTSYNVHAGVQTHVFIKTLCQHIPVKQMHEGRS